MVQSCIQGGARSRECSGKADQLAGVATGSPTLQAGQSIISAETAKLVTWVYGQSTKKEPCVGDWVAANNVELAYVPPNASYLNRIECHFFTPPRYFALNGTDRQSHEEKNPMPRCYIAWRNRHKDAKTLRAISLHTTMLPDAAPACNLYCAQLVSFVVTAKSKPLVLTAQENWSSSSSMPKPDRSESRTLPSERS